jgi:WW domain
MHFIWDDPLRFYISISRNPDWRTFKPDSDTLQDVHTFELKRSNDNLAVSGLLSLQIVLRNPAVSPSPLFDPLTAPTADGAEPLPAGWEERQTPHGRVYYVDRKFRVLAVS